FLSLPDAPLWRGFWLATLSSNRCVVCLEKADTQIRRGVDDLAVRLQRSIRDGEFQSPQDDALQVHHILDLADRRENHARKLHLAHAKRPAAAGRPEPTQKESGQLPEGIETQAPRHHRIAFEVTL